MIELSDSICEDECEKPASDSGRQKTWMPNAMVWDWQERAGDQLMCSVVIDLPSGVVNDNKNFTVAVGCGNDTAILSCEHCECA